MTSTASVPTVSDGDAGMPWAGIWSQPEAVATLQHAASDPAGLAHAWLLTGPPGSGRSNLAHAFAASLIAEPGDEAALRQVLAGTHPDLTVLRTEQLIIRIDEARALVSRAAYAPSAGRRRVIVVEDADRMPERTSNVLLKALEEPPETTVWILCAPSDADLLPTIRSRVRTLRLREPSLDAVANLIVNRAGVSLELAEQSARHAQHHIGMAQRLATDEAARARREETLRAVLGIRGVGDSVRVAGRIVEVATEDANALTADRDQTERDELLALLGVAPGKAVPPVLRSQVRVLEEDQKRRAKRSLRDGIDRVLTDLQSLFRDVAVFQLDPARELINVELRDEIARVGAEWGPERTLVVLDDIQKTRRNLEGNVAPLLALESMLVTVASGRTT